MAKRTLIIKLNGEKVETLVEPSEMLVDVLRDSLRLIGAKIGCSRGECGACTVLVNGKAVNSCIVPALSVMNKEVVTIEGVAPAPGKLHPLQETFMDYGAVQCGFCTPGMIIAAKALLDENPDPTEEEVRVGISGTLCRCTGYVKIVEAVLAAARKMRGGS